eukprot:gene85-112_t
MENNTVKQLSLLLELQDIDNQINTILQVRGDLPQEVKKLEDDLSNLQSQELAHQEQITGLEEGIASFRVKVRDIEAKVKHYEEQQANVRNNREYDAITKEIELHQLDIQLAEKRIKESYGKIEQSKYAIETLQRSIDKVAQALTTKQEDLGAIVGESKGTEEKLNKKRQQLQAKIDSSLIRDYEKIKHNVGNNLAVVEVSRGACGGCFTMIYPQLQSEIREKRQVIKCEHCGRILADVLDVVGAAAVLLLSLSEIAYVRSRWLCFCQFNPHRSWMSELKEFKKLILEKLDKARKELVFIQEALDKSNDNSVEVSVKLLEEVPDTIEKESLGMLVDRQRKYIVHLENALTRIQNGTYGVCTVTGELIDKERLKVVPHSRHSVFAKRAKEEKEK